MPAIYRHRHRVRFRPLFLRISYTPAPSLTITIPYILTCYACMHAASLFIAKLNLVTVDFIRIDSSIAAHPQDAFRNLEPAVQRNCSKSVKEYHDCLLWKNLWSPWTTRDNRSPLCPCSRQRFARSSLGTTRRAVPCAFCSRTVCGEKLVSKKCFILQIPSPSPSLLQIPRIREYLLYSTPRLGGVENYTEKEKHVVNTSETKTDEQMAT